MDAVKEKGDCPVPSHLRDAHYSGASNLGNVGYKYAHIYDNHYVEQQYLPDKLVNEKFYEPGELGFEKQSAEWLRYIRANND